MLRLEDITAGSRVQGLTPHGAATIKLVEWFGEQGVTVWFVDERRKPDQTVLYRDDPSRTACSASGYSNTTRTTSGRASW